MITELKARETAEEIRGTVDKMFVNTMIDVVEHYMNGGVELLYVYREFLATLTHFQLEKGVEKQVTFALLDLRESLKAGEKEGYDEVIDMINTLIIAID